MATSVWGSLLSDVWRYLARRYLSTGSLRKLSLLNSKFLELSRSISRSCSSRLEFVYGWQPQPDMTILPYTFSCFRIAGIFTLFSDMNVVLLAMEAAAADLLTIVRVNRSKLEPQLTIQTIGYTADVVSYIDGQFLVLKLNCIHLYNHLGERTDTVDLPESAFRMTCDRNSGNVFVSLQDTILVLSPLLAQIRKLHCPISCGLASLRGELFAITESSHITVFDIDSGRQLRSFPLPTWGTNLYSDGHSVLVAAMACVDTNGVPLRAFDIKAVRSVITQRGDMFAVVRDATATDLHRIVRLSEPFLS